MRLGALVIQTLTTTILAQDVPAALTMMIKAAVVVIVCLLQSENFRELFKRGWRKVRRTGA
jgi:simple sugar transport system permease protein